MIGRMTSMTTLVVALTVSVAAWLAWASLERYELVERYELIAGGGSSGNMVYRLDHKSGEVCMYRWWPKGLDHKVRDAKGQATEYPEGFALVECAK